MNGLHIHLLDARTSFHPGSAIAGRIAWSLEEAPRTIGLELIWLTRGKGIPDEQIVHSLFLENPPAHDERAFQFLLPAMPYSCRGKLLKIEWLLRLEASPRRQQITLPLIVSPTLQEIDLAASLGTQTI